MMMVMVMVDDADDDGGGGGGDDDDDDDNVRASKVPAIPAQASESCRNSKNFPGPEIGVAERIERRRSERLNRTGMNLIFRSTATDENHQKLLLLLLLPLLFYFYN